ncbi:MAG: PAS domain S-box protein [Candidatus Peregrinibacteria bacterium]|nr:PAS domain S-box protein [Candidatus Peregrinibacteria bacterium]
MILIPHGRKIALIATSLFITTFSLVFFFAGSPSGKSGDLQANVLADFFHSSGETTSSVEKEGVVAALDLSGNVVEINTAFSEAFGYSAKDVSMKNFFTLLLADDLPTFASDFSGVSTSGKILVNAGPFHLMSSDGKEHIVLVTLDLVKREGGENKVVIVTIKDITESLDKGKKPDSVAPQGKSIKELDTTDSSKNRIIVEKTV